MFAIVRTGGKQYRVAAGDKIVVEKLAGEAGDTITLDDVLLAGDGGDLKSTAGLTVSAEIIAQAKADKVTVFKKKRRHNYRRKRGHRQQHTILKIVAIGGEKAKPAKAKAEPAAEPKAKSAKPEAEAAEAKPAAAKAPKAKAEASKSESVKSEPTASEMTDTPKAAPKKASTKKPASGKNA
jgi:large subunit ribosomal protein L21